MLTFLFNNGVKYIFAHNWSGFDSILLFKYIEPHFNTDPVFFDGKIIAVKLYDKGTLIHQNSTPIATILDSIKILPLSLSKLASSFENRWG